MPRLARIAPDEHIYHILTRGNNRQDVFKEEKDYKRYIEILHMTNTAGTHNYAYDTIYRLTQATHPVPPTEQFTYDPVGNRQTDGLGNSYFYNNANRLLNYNGVTYQYDANGNATSRIDACGTTTYTWDSENRLTGISGFRPDCSALSASYKYDPFGRRIEKNVNGAITKYLYDEEDILLEYDGNNQIVARYTHGPRIDEPLSIADGQSYYYHTDARGSIIAITDSAGNVVQRYEYDSFGNIVSTLDPNFIQPYTYTAREYDPESGLYFYRARYYDAKVGRFISEGPILRQRILIVPLLRQRLLKIPSLLNSYIYSRYNPVNRSDLRRLYGKGFGDPVDDIIDIIEPPEQIDPGQEICKERNRKLLEWFILRRLWDLLTPPFTTYPPGYGDEGPGYSDPIFFPEPPDR